MPTHFTVYKTTNLVNDKIYIGYHETEDPNDGYLGSGHALRAAIKKYGRASFKKEVLFDFSSFEEMVAKERELVTTEFKRDPKTYNIVEGGPSAFTTMSKEQLRALSRRGAKAWHERYDKDPEFQAMVAERLRRVSREAVLSGSRKGQKTFAGRRHTPEARAKMSMPRPASAGERNSQFGTVWVCREGERPCKVPKSLLHSLLAEGWCRGRKNLPPG